MYSVQAIWDEGWDLYKKKKYSQAIEKFSKVEKNICNDKVYFVVAQCYWTTGEYSKGLHYFKQAHQHSENPQQLILPLIKSYIFLNKKNKARKLIKEGLKENKLNQELLLFDFVLNYKRTSKANIKPIVDCIKSSQTFTSNVARLLMACLIFGIHKNEVDKTKEALAKVDFSQDELILSLKQIRTLNPTIKLFNTNLDLLQYSLKQIAVDGLVIEAGVFFGHSINTIAKILKKEKVYGFDSFEGLPEAWNDNEGAGAYSTEGRLPEVRKNVRLIKGWFKDTMPDFIEEHNKAIAFLHVDCDIYSSTRDVFNSLKNNIVVGTLILFDDFYGFPNSAEHEWKAFKEFLKEQNLQAQFLACCTLGREMLVRIIN